MTVKSKNSRRTSRDSEDAPEITDKWIAEATLYHGKKLVRRGRPAGLARRVRRRYGSRRTYCGFFRATGPGWQTRMDNALKRYVGLAEALSPGGEPSETSRSISRLQQRLDVAGSSDPRTAALLYRCSHVPHGFLG